jgi:hypothetical protein
MKQEGQLQLGMRYSVHMSAVIAPHSFTSKVPMPSEDLLEAHDPRISRREQHRQKKRSAQKS